MGTETPTTFNIPNGYDMFEMGQALIQERLEERKKELEKAKEQIISLIKAEIYDVFTNEKRFTNITLFQSGQFPVNFNSEINNLFRVSTLQHELMLASIVIISKMNINIVFDLMLDLIHVLVPSVH